MHHAPRYTQPVHTYNPDVHSADSQSNMCLYTYTHVQSTTPKRVQDRPCMHKHIPIVTHDKHTYQTYPARASIPG